MRTAILATAFSALTLLPVTALAETATINGSAGYRERIALLPGAVLEVSLQDVSRADAAANVLSSQRFAMTAVPHSFSLSYDPELIDERFSYTVSARILVEDKVLFRTTSHNAVLTRGAGEQVDLMLTKMQSTGSASDGSPSDTAKLAGTQWVVLEMGGKSLDQEALPTLQFDEAGRVAAHAGCNRFNGGYEQEGTNLSFSANMAGTMMACPPPVDELERELIASIGQVSGLEAQSDGLNLVDRQGEVVLRLRPGN